MRFLLSSFYVAAALVNFLSNTASAAAIPRSEDAAHLAKRAPPYPEDTEIKAAFVGGPMVFYSNLPGGPQRLSPRNFAKTIPGAHTAKTAFGKQANGRDFTDVRDFPAPAPDAATQGALYNDFAARFSRIMAQNADGPDAFVVLVAKDGPTGPKQDSIWTEVEEPALKANSKIKQIIRVSPTDFSVRETLFTRPGTPPSSPKRDETSLESFEERDLTESDAEDEDIDSSDLISRAALGKAPAAKPVPAKPAPVKPAPVKPVPVKPTPAKSNPVTKPATKPKSTPLLKFSKDWNDPPLGPPPA